MNKPCSMQRCRKVVAALILVLVTVEVWFLYSFMGESIIKLFKEGLQ